MLQTGKCKQNQITPRPNHMPFSGFFQKSFVLGYQVITNKK